MNVCTVLYYTVHVKHRYPIAGVPIPVAYVYRVQYQQSIRKIEKSMSWLTSLHLFVQYNTASTTPLLYWYYSMQMTSVAMYGVVPECYH